jgi:hypothetical protein
MERDVRCGLFGWLLGKALSSPLQSSFLILLEMDENKECKDLLKEMMGILDEGCRPNRVALDALRSAKNKLAYCARQDNPQSGK